LAVWLSETGPDGIVQSEDEIAAIGMVLGAGASMVVEPQLSADERSSLDPSANVLREAAAALVA
jgi:malate/lactate dehydrogenase